MQYKSQTHKEWFVVREFLPLVVLFWTCFAINSDQLVSAPNLTRIARDFSLSDSERDGLLGALVQFTFYMSAGFFSILSGPFIEVVDRAKLLGSLSAISGILSLLCGSVPVGRVGFFYFILIRVSTGISVGVALPAAFSLLGDLVPVSRRTTMSAFVTTSCAAGAAVGQALAGFLPSSWRTGYFIVACFSLVAAFACFFGPLMDAKQHTTLYEHEAPGWSSTISKSPRPVSFSPGDLNQFTTVLQVPSNRIIFAQSIFGCIGWSSIATFFPDFLHEELGFSVVAATGVMAVFGISGLCSSLIGSAMGQSIYNSQRSKLPLFVAATMVCSAFFMTLLALFGSRGLGTIILAAGGAAGAAAGPNMKGMLLNANSAGKRGTVFAMFNLIDCLGKGIGPSVLVALSYIFQSRRTAFAIAFLLWLVAAWIESQLEDCLTSDTVSVEIEAKTKPEPFDLFDLFHS